MILFIAKANGNESKSWQPGDKREALVAAFSPNLWCGSWRVHWVPKVPHCSIYASFLPDCEYRKLIYRNKCFSSIGTQRLKINTAQLEQKVQQYFITNKSQSEIKERIQRGTTTRVRPLVPLLVEALLALSAFEWKEAMIPFLMIPPIDWGSECCGTWRDRADEGTIVSNLSIIILQK